MTLLLIKLISTLFTLETFSRIPAGLWLQLIVISFSSRLSLVLGVHWLLFFLCSFWCESYKHCWGVPDAMKQMCSEWKTKEIVAQQQGYVYLFASKWDLYEGFFVGSPSVKAFVVFHRRSNSTIPFFFSSCFHALFVFYMRICLKSRVCFKHFSWIRFIKRSSFEKALRCVPCWSVNTISSSEDCSQQGRPKQGNLAI